LRRNWFVAVDQACILAHPDDRRRTPVDSDLRIEQRPEAAEHERCRVDIRQPPLFVEFGPAQCVLRRADQDLEVLTDDRVLFGLQQRLQLRQRLFGRLGPLAPRLVGEAADLLVEAGHAELPRAFRRKAREYVQQHLRVTIALRNPRTRVCRRLRAGRRSDTGSAGGHGNRQDQDQAPHVHQPHLVCHALILHVDTDPPLQNPFRPFPAALDQRAPT
jgi:hypothetical protein